MIISARVIRRPRTASMCPVRVSHDCTVFLAAHAPRVRLFGCAWEGDRPYAMAICIPCARAGVAGRTDDTEERLRIALARYDSEACVPPSARDALGEQLERAAMATTKGGR